MKKRIFQIILFVLFASQAATPICLAQQTNGVAPNPQNSQIAAENDRLPFMQTPDSAVNNEPSSGSLLLRTFGAMILIVGLIFVGAWGLKKLGLGNTKGSSEDALDLTILSSVSLGSGRTISTVRFGERVLLVGSTAQAFTLLADESENKSVSHIKPMSVAEMLADENGDSFLSELTQAEINLEGWQAKGVQLS